jgi:fructose transport system permease protein
MLGRTMSDTQEFEKAAAASPRPSLSSTSHDQSVVKRIQHALHQTPSLVPLIVLLDRC